MPCRAPRVLDLAVYEELLDRYAQKAVDTFNERGELETRMQLLELSADIEGYVIKSLRAPPKLMRDTVKSDESKGAMMAFVREVLTDGTPTRKRLKSADRIAIDAVVVMSEAWQSEKPELGRASFDPERSEILIIAMHTPLGSTTTICQVEQTPKRRAVFRPAAEQGRVETRGRLSLN